MNDAQVNAEALFIVLTDDLPWFQRWRLRRLERKLRKREVKAKVQRLRNVMKQLEQYATDTLPRDTGNLN